jgi:hypothetical protein
MHTASIPDLPGVLAALTTTGVIQWSRVDDDGVICIDAVLTYLDDDDPSRGYDDRGKAVETAVRSALAPFDYAFSDGGFNDDGSGVSSEWWIFRRTSA